MSRHTISGPATIIEARTAALLERLLDLNAVRVAVRGHDHELDEILLDLHSVAMQHIVERHDRDIFRTIGSSLANPRKFPETWDTAEVAARTDCTTRAVRFAAAEGRLAGEQIAGRWTFTPEAVATWQANRKRK
jgi:hypothetical protein